MRKALLVALVATLFAVGSGMFIRASADPEIGQGISGFKMKITEFDVSGDFSVKTVCRKGETKHFAFDAGFKPGVKGHFVQIASSETRLKLTDGEVVKARGYAVDASRRLLAFLLPATESGRRVSIDLSGNNRLILAAKGGVGPRDILLTPVASFCVKLAQPAA